MILANESPATYEHTEGPAVTGTNCVSYWLQLRLKGVIQSRTYVVLVRFWHMMLLHGSITLWIIHRLTQDTCYLYT